MTFQGDVAGLGLGELLQGLARGGREGVLNLLGGGITARIGVLDGQLWLLPDEGENPETWRRRCEKAWANDPDERIDTLRMREIAQAARLEVMFALLDCHGVHFRFEPGSLRSILDAGESPDTSGAEENRLETGVVIEVRSAVLCPPVSVEYILLEHARLSDELSSYPDSDRISGHFVPRGLGSQAPQRSFERLWQECDGSSSVTEIADRLGWPTRQARASLCGLHAAGALRLADAHEMLALAQRELEAGQFARAASRLSGWCILATAGPATQEEARLLLDEWNAGRLVNALEHMHPHSARALLHKLDGADGDHAASCARWLELRRQHRHDFLIEFATLHRLQRSPNEADWPAINDLLRVARRMQDRGHPWRSGLVLRTAAARTSTPVPVRLEIGQRMMSVGLLNEGATWVIDASRAFVAAGAPERAVAALRQLLELMPTHREARSLLGSAYGRTASGRRLRRNTLIGLAGTLLVSVAAVVHVRTDQAYQEKLSAVREELDDPQRALAALELHFGQDGGGDEIQVLRFELHRRIRERQVAAQQDWIALFLDCNLECTSGDPVLGLRNALAMPQMPPAPSTDNALPPKLQTLLENLLARLEDMLLGAGQAADPLEQSHAEQRLERLIDDLLAVTTAVAQRAEIATFRERLDSLKLTLEERSEIRAQERERELRSRDIERLDALYAAGKAHAAAGDLARAVDCFDQFEASPGAAPILHLFRPELDAVRAHHRAVLEARELATAGRHVEALAALKTACERPGEHLLPCRIDSVPSGAYVRFPDGTSRTTPFVLEAAPGERLRAKVESSGCEPTELVLDQPADRVVLLSRRPDSTWPATSPVEAPPVSVDDDHVVCDRSGRIARLAPDGSTEWNVQLPGPMGIRHAPVFLPRRAGSLLVSDEEGAVWIVDAASGRVEGPYATGAQPLGGPLPTQDGARLRTVDGRELSWTTRVAPDAEVTLDRPDAEASAPRHDAGLAVRRRVLHESNLLESPWGQGRVLATDTHYTYTRAGGEGLTFAVERKGEWSYMAFEAPSARAPKGRLWVSDGFGLRSYSLDLAPR